MICLKFKTNYIACNDINFNLQQLYSLLLVLQDLRNKDFYHGDFKSDNVLIDIFTNDVQIIDLEHSRILEDVNHINNNDVCIYNDKNLSLNKRIMQLYDIYKLAMTINVKNMEDVILLYKNCSESVIKDFTTIYYIKEYNDMRNLYITNIEYFKNMFIYEHFYEHNFDIHYEYIRNEIKKSSI